MPLSTLVVIFGNEQFSNLTVKENPNYQFVLTVIQIWTKLQNLRGIYLFVIKPYLSPK